MTKRKAIALDGHEIHNCNNNMSETSSNINNDPSSVVQQNGPSPTIVEQQQQMSNGQNDDAMECNNVNSGVTGGSNQHKNKKERADNWSSAEIQVLHKSIESRRDIFFGPQSQATKKNRDLAWEAITKEVNAVSTTPRSLSQVMKKFKNEKCRAKRKFTEPEKDGHTNSLNSINNVSNSNSSTSTTNNGITNDTLATSSLNAQTHASSNNQHQTQLQQQSHHMTSNEQMSAPQPSINVVKLAPQNVAKTMIDLQNNVQQIQMPNDDMVLIVPPDMDGLLSGVNIVSDGNGHHHFQKCTSNNAITNQHQHNQHNQHSLQTLNSGQNLVNGTLGNGMMARAIPAGSMCSLVYSTSNEVCAPDHHMAPNVVNQASLSSNHLGINAQSFAHHRGSIEHNQHHQQIHQQQQPQQHTQHTLHQSQTTNLHNQSTITQNQISNATTLSGAGGIAIESQLKNLLFNLLLRDGQHSSVPDKHRNDMLAIIATSLTKIEGHLSKISKASSILLAQNMNLSDNPGSSNLNIGNSDGNNNNVDLSISNSNSIQTNRRDNER